MSVELTEKAVGKEELISTLERYRKELDDGTVVRQKLNMLIDKIVDEAIARCPKVTGTLASTIRAVQGAAGLFGGGMKAFSIYDMSIVAGDPSVINPKSGRPCNYAEWVHDGHPTKSGGFVVGQPFLTEAMMMYENEIDRVVDEALKKIGKMSGM